MNYRKEHKHKSRLLVTVNQKRCVPALQGNGETLKKVFDLESGILSPATSVLTAHFLQKRERVPIPATECFNNKGLEKDPFSLAVVEVGPQWNSKALSFVLFRVGWFPISFTEPVAKGGGDSGNNFQSRQNDAQFQQLNNQR